MTPISEQKFVEHVCDWATIKVRDIANRWPQRGGWEGWAQADIYGHLVQLDSTFDVLREQLVYTDNRKRADFLLNSQSAKARPVVVELKAQSLENWKAFVPGLQDDVQKLRRELKPKYASAALLVVGLYFTNCADIPPDFAKEVIITGEIGVCWAIGLNG